MSDVSPEFQEQAHQFMNENDELLRRLARSERSEDPCPQCGDADLVPFGAKYRCPTCGYLQPCCQP